MPDDFVSAAPPILRTTATSVPAVRVLPQIQVMPLNSLRISLADYVQLSLQAGFIQRPAIRHPYHHVKGDSRLIRRPSVAIVRSPNACATTVFRRLSRRVKQPALARFSPDVSPLFVHFRADDDVTARLYAREVTDCSLSF